MPGYAGDGCGVGRDVLNNDEVNSTEFDRSTPYPVIDLMPEQHVYFRYGRNDAPGFISLPLQPGTKAAMLTQVSSCQERHRHRFEFNNDYREALAKGGMRFSGISPDGRLVEIAEIADHPFMVGTQFHPEFLSRPNRPHPLFVAFMKAVRDHAGVVRL